MGRMLYVISERLAAGLVNIRWGSEGSEWPGQVRQLEQQVSNAGAERAAVKQTGWAREGGVEGARALLQEPELPNLSCC